MDLFRLQPVRKIEVSYSKIRKSIFALAAIETIYLIIGTLFNIIVKYFLTIGYYPVALLGETLNLINVAALILLSTTISLDIESGSTLVSKYEIAVLVLLLPISYHYLSTIRHGLYLVGGIGVLLYIKGRNWNGEFHYQAIRRAALGMNVGCLIIIGTDLLAVLKWSVQLAVILMGLYYLTMRFEPMFFNQEIWPDPVELIYRPLSELAQSSLGTIYAGLAIVAMYWVSKAAPNILVAPVSVESYLRLSNVPFYTTVLAAPFLFLMFVYWTYILRRLPYSVDYWIRDKFVYEKDSNIPARLSLNHFLLFFTGWLIAVAPQWFARLSPQGMGSDQIITFCYLFVLIFLFALSLTFLHSPTSKNLYLHSVSGGDSIKKDHKHVLASFTIVTIAICFGALIVRGTPHDLIYVPALLITAFLDLYYRDVYVLGLVTYILPLLVMVLPFLIDSYSYYWPPALFIAIGFFSMKISGNITEIVEKHQ